MEVKEALLNIFVVGFHHKKGCQIEFSYPKIDVLPDSWKHLPSLAMPDGAHNFTHDSVFFHLPGVETPFRTVFGVSCFRQIPLASVKCKTEDMTRSTVQKAICVLASVPLYGYIKIKMELITAAFFDAGDFSDTSLLIDAYHHLNNCLPGSFQNHLHDGLSARDLLVRFKHKTLVLFKLLLLERKVVFFHSPVEPLCSGILSLLSLVPHLIENGLYFSALASPCGTPTKTVSLQRSSSLQSQMNDIKTPEDICNGMVEPTEISVAKEKSRGEENDEMAAGSALEQDIDREYGVDALLLNNDLTYDVSSRSSGCDISILNKLDLNECGFPLSLFDKSNLCFPYLSISYLDFLSTPGVRGFLVGATNVLFKQKRSLTDVVIDLEDAKIETTCPDLRKQLALTTEDLRFLDIVLRGACDPTEPANDDWIRSHFHLYLVTLLRTSLLPDGSREQDSFNQSFMAAWKETHNYKMWSARDNYYLAGLEPGHPTAGALSVQDVKLKISQVMQSTEGGRKLNQAVASTGKAVGGAVTQARGLISGWWSSFTQDPKQIKTVENI